MNYDSPARMAIGVAEMARLALALARRLEGHGIGALVGCGYIVTSGLYLYVPSGKFGWRMTRGFLHSGGVADPMEALAIGIEHVREAATQRLAGMRDDLARLEADVARLMAAQAQIAAAVAAEAAAAEAAAAESPPPR
jgi:hypothetical protein